MSAVSVSVIDWTTIGLFPPIFTLPTLTKCVIFLKILSFYHNLEISLNEIKIINSISIINPNP